MRQRSTRWWSGLRRGSSTRTKWAGPGWQWPSTRPSRRVGSAPLSSSAETTTMSPELTALSGTSTEPSQNKWFIMKFKTLIPGKLRTSRMDLLSLPTWQFRTASETRSGEQPGSPFITEEVYSTLIPLLRDSSFKGQQLSFLPK